jgi:hypothetical protein
MVYRRDFICRGSAPEGLLNRLAARGLSGVEWFDHECILPPIRLRHHHRRMGNNVDNGGSLGVCTTWGILGKDLHLLDVLRRRMEAVTAYHAALEEWTRERAPLSRRCDERWGGNRYPVEGLFRREPGRHRPSATRSGRPHATSAL